MKRVLLSWSSGKDSAWSLHVLREDPGLEVVGLLTTLNEAFDRVAMHAVRRELLEAQAEAAGLPLQTVPIPWPCSNEQYEKIMAEVSVRAREAGVGAVAFGDLFLRDIRAYREQQLRGTGLEPLFPLWNRDTRILARDMIAAGLRAKVTCVDPKCLAPGFAGRDFDRQFLDDLPAGVDPCGENGEFHSFVYAAPVFDKTLPIRIGEIVERDGFVFADVIHEQRRVGHNAAPAASPG
ncbi:MAG TPA: ATP-binding protein [Terriglobia bacterium]|nr:ATP-binding protein [Terriglobia bacterium]